MTVRVRIAPSPTGNFHLGTARTALFNWLFARRHGGQFVLRIEDTDRERSKDAYTQNILDGMAWLGLTYDEGPIFQTQRLETYAAAVNDLLDRGLAYRCYCTEAELEAMREEQRRHKQAPRYDNRHRHLTAAQQAAFEAEGRRPVIRFKIEEPREVGWQDLVRGDMRWNTRDLGGDMVIARTEADGTIGLPLYNFAVVVDDIDMAITHVIRGEDHIANTAKQILLYEAFGAAIPQFGHTPLILNAQGAKLSKRDGATAVDDFRAMGYLPEAFTNYMILLGWSPPDGQELFTLQEATQVFDFDRVNKAGARFDWDKLNWINSQYIRKLSVADLRDRLIPFWQGAGYAVGDDPDWLLALTELIAPSLNRLSDAVAVAKLFFQEPEFEEEAIAALQGEGIKRGLTEIRDRLAEASELTADSLGALVAEAAKETGIKKGSLMKPLRAALTGATRGPELMPSLLLLHRQGKAVSRLQRALEL